MKTKNLLAWLIVLGFCLLQTGNSFAASASFVGINSISVDCSATTIDINLKTNVIANVSDYNFGGTNYDLFELVLYDGAGTAFAYKATIVSVGANGTFNIGYSIFMNLPSYRPFTVKFYDLSVFPSNFTEAQAGILLDSLTFNPNNYVISPCTDLPFLPLPAVSSTEPQPAFSDGRLNNWDTGNPVVVYGHDDESGRGLVVYSPQGALLLLVSPAEIAAIAECPSENTLIASAGNIALYRLSDCRYQLNAPSLDGTKTYVLIFNDLYENTGYTSYEE